MESSVIAEASDRMRAWMEEGQQMLARTIPALLHERDELKAKLAAATLESQRLVDEAAALRRELSDAQDRYDKLRGGQGELVEGVVKFLGQLASVLEPMQDLAEKMRRVTAP